MSHPVHGRGRRDEARRIKCLVWDLDNTIWNGVLLEDENVSLKDTVREVLHTLDGRGILQSIASKNDYAMAMAKLREFHIDQYFLYPQINWNSKLVSLERIRESLNIGIDTIALIDDEVFEREEVKFTFPQVLCIDGAALDTLLTLPEMTPRFITEDSRKRRAMYLDDIERNKAEDEFVGAKEDFLRTLNMMMTISEANEQDLKRAEELTVRTHQLNTTGYTYSYDELDRFRKSDAHQLLLATLEDKFGAYGKIGLALVETIQDVRTIKLLLMSCRVLSRGVGSIMINHIRNEARRRNTRLRAEMICNERNRMMYMAFKFTHFKEKEKRNGLVILENDLEEIQHFPDYVQVRIEE